MLKRTLRLLLGLEKQPFRGSKQLARFRPHLEVLEDRMVPSSTPSILYVNVANQGFQG